MPVAAVVGGHWGDEGKGKVVDALAAHADMVIRYNGGNNAGHTIVGPHGTLKLHLVPSGICHPDVECLIGPGVVVDPAALLEEIAMLHKSGVSTARLRLSTRAHLVFPFHVGLDAKMEATRGGRAHGTTKRGIWPVYADKAARVGVRAGDLLEPGFLAGRLSEIARRASSALGAPIPIDEIAALTAVWTERLGPMVADTHPLVQTALRRDARIILEGHLGVMRDLDWGVYPYVTSSTCLAGGACAGAGVPAQRISRVIGVVKAYTTAVGAGPMPTELRDEVGDALREHGHEYGTSTNRPRRCGWFDAVAARFAAEVSGFTDLAVMKLDVLDGFDTVKIGVAYRDGARRIETVPHTAVMERVEPLYDDVPGWTSTSEARTFDELAPAARAFIGRIEALVGVPVSIIGVGREREALITAPAGLGVAV